MSIRSTIQTSIEKTLDHIMASVYIPAIVAHIQDEHKETTITEESLIKLLDIKAPRPAPTPVVPPLAPAPATRVVRGGPKLPINTCLYRKTKGAQERCTTSRTGHPANGMCKTHEKSIGGQRQRDEMMRFYNVDSLETIEEPLDSYEAASRKGAKASAGSKAKLTFGIPQPKKKIGGFSSVTVEGEDYITKDNVLFRNLDNKLIAYGAIRNNKLTLDLTNEERAVIEVTNADLSEPLVAAYASASEFNDQEIEGLDDIDMDDFELSE